MADLLTDTTVLWALDFDAEFACEVELEAGERCGASADWVVVCIFCGYAVMECNPCLVFIAGSAPDHFDCDDCGAFKVNLFDLVRIEGVRK